MHKWPSIEHELHWAEKKRLEFVFAKAADFKGQSVPERKKLQIIFRKLCRDSSWVLDKSFLTNPARTRLFRASREQRLRYKRDTQYGRDTSVLTQPE